MKKDIERLKFKIREELESWCGVEGGIDEDGIKNILNSIDQLDAPEVLSKEWINKHITDGHNVNLGDKVIYADELDGVLVPKQELPVIPKYVDDWITKHRGEFDLYPALKELEDNTLGWELTYKWYRTNTHKFVNAYLTGEYEVNEEQLYYALIKGHELFADEGDWTCNYWNLSIPDGRVFPSDRFSRRNKTLVRMSKEEWSEYGINDSNADFRKVGDV